MNSEETKLKEEPQNFSPSPDFRWLCDELFVKIDEIASKKNITSTTPIASLYFEVIERFINIWRKTVGNDIYPAIILVLPYRDRRTFNIKDVTLIKAICLYLKLPKNSFTERRLLNWKQKASRNEKLSNFCVEEIRRRRSESLQVAKDSEIQHHRVVTIDGLNEKLDFLVQERNTKGRGYKNLADSSVFKYCLENMSFVELKYFFDILLKNRIIGGQEHKFLNIWHPDAQDYLSVVSDLRTVTKKLWDPNFRLKQNDLTVRAGFTFSPQLAKKANTSYSNMCKKFKNDFYIEEKMDGERIQLHFLNYGEDIKFLSRRGTDFTYLYGDNLTKGTIAKYLSLSPDVKNCILDGEMVTFDKERNIMLPFGIVKSSAMNILTKGDISNESYYPFFVVFDLLFLNDVPLVDFPLFQRKEYLLKILRPAKEKVEIISSMRCDNELSIKTSLENAIAIGSEGIVLKGYHSKYIAASRNDSWIKVKPEYLEQFGENMDLIVMGRDPGKKDSLLCGLIVFENEESMKNDVIDLDSVIEMDEEKLAEETVPKKLKCIMSFCNIANGISLEEFKEIDRKTRGHWKNSENNPPPNDLLLFGSKIPAEWIHPTNSVVLEVKARSLDNTDASAKRYKVGCTLYGGYCRQIRYDKDWTSCYSATEFYRDRQSRSRNFKRGTHIMISPKRKKASRNYGLLDYDYTEDGSPEKKSELFKGLFFYIMSDFIDCTTNNRKSKENIIECISEHGGIIIHNILQKRSKYNKLRLISSKMTNECKILVKRGYDVLSPKWIFDCIRSNRLVELEPDHCFNVSDELLALSWKRVDKYNDGYKSLINKDIISQYLSLNSSYDLEQYEFDEGLRTIPYFLFNGRIVYIPDDLEYNESVTELDLKIKLFGGKLTKQVDKANLVVVATKYKSNIISIVGEIRRIFSKRVYNSSEVPKIPYIVNSKWVDDSIEQNIQLPEENYVIINK